MNCLKTPATVLADISATEALRDKGSNAFDTMGLNDPYVDEYRRTLAKNADDIASLLQVNKVPEPARVLLNEMLFDAIKEMTQQAPRLADSVLLQLVWWGFKTGKFFCSYNQQFKQKTNPPTNQQQGPKSYKKNDVTKRHANKDDFTFKFDYKQFPLHKKPFGKASRYCKFCVEAAIRNGAMTKADNPPPEAWFKSREAVDEHTINCPNK